MLREVAPNTVYVGGSPDRSDVDTLRVKVPEYIIKTDTVYRWMDRAEGIFTETTPSVNISVDLNSLDMGFLVLPLKNGNPAVNVTSDLTTIDTFNPSNAQNITLEYNHPEDWLDFGPFVNTTYNWNNSLDTQVKFGVYSDIRKSMRIDIGFNAVPNEKKISTSLGIELKHDLTQYW